MGICPQYSIQTGTIGRIILDGVAVRDAGFSLPELKKDYDKMQIMMFEKSPSFQEIMDILLELESTINDR